MSTETFEIELKAILSFEQYQRLLVELPKRMQFLKKDTVYTTRYRPGDVRLRKSSLGFELVCKQGDVTDMTRKEMCIPLSPDQAEGISHVFDVLGFKSDPSWTQHKTAFQTKVGDFTYSVCLQHIEQFAYLLEVEHLSTHNDSAIHEPVIRTIIEQAGCKPLNPIEFSRQIEQYVQKQAQ